MDTDAEREDAPPQDGQDQLAASAQGWHRIQLAVLGFIGLCGVLQAGDEIEPEWLDQVAGGLAIAALVVSCVAVYLVGRVAWPYGTPSSPGRPVALAGASAARVRTLRWGVGLTYLATTSMALAALSNWWPGETSEGGSRTGFVEVSGSDGRSWCGRLVDAPAGSLRIETDDGAVDLAGGTVAGIVSVESC